jgi:hypothetical protein
MIAVIILALLPLLGGCATQWTRADTGAEQISQDLDSCSELAQDEYPIKWSSTLPNYQSLNSIGCIGGGDCRPEPGTPAQDPSKDINRVERDNAVMACMESRGYSQP